MIGAASGSELEFLITTYVADLVDYQIKLANVERYRAKVAETVPETSPAR
jgi:hypothetical protein